MTIRFSALVLLLMVSVGCKRGGEAERLERFDSQEALLNACYGTPLMEVPMGPNPRFEELSVGWRRLGKLGTDLVARPLTAEEEADVEARTERWIAREFDELSGRLRQRVDRIGGRLQAVLPRAVADEIEFSVVTDSRVNAFMTPSGHSVVFRGLAVRADDDELAGVMAHEIAHFMLKHSERTVRAAYLGQRLGGKLGDTMSGIGETAAVIVTMILESPYDQQQELEADRLGVCIMHRAGYEAEAAHRLMQELTAGRSRGSEGVKRIVSDIIATHPAPDHRLRALQDAADDLD